MEELVCTHCGNIGHIETELIDSLGRKHIKASCAECGKHIKFLQQGQSFKFHFGKYKGHTIENVPRDYLEWCADNLSNNTAKRKIAEYLKGAA